MIHMPNIFIEQKAIEQAVALMNSDSSNYKKLYLLPDAHYCEGLAPVGTALYYKDRFDTNIVSADIGCGVGVFRLGDINLEAISLLSTWIDQRFIDDGLEYKYKEEVEALLSACTYNCFTREELKSIFLESYGTIGKGNYFIELSRYYEDIKGKDDYYLVIHSGSRTLGGKALKKLDKIALEEYKKVRKLRIETKIKALKKKGKFKEISEAIKEPDLDKDILLSDFRFKYYRAFHNLACWFARQNRFYIAKKISEFLGSSNFFICTDTFHNYVDYDKKVVHKGSIGVNSLQTVAIPLNMRDGTILAITNHNPKEWNYNLPHGAGRVKSRKEALETITEEEYLKEIEGITTNGVHIDESPSVYKDGEQIYNILKDVLHQIKILKPIYSYKE